ncbi:MAG: oligopeptide transporter, OPT family [Candidatus Marinimicrobia bacterium]|nr:oligopeptide transporter, OPT family [Candidatus Neomarinimicrobiota bacterium]
MASKEFKPFVPPETSMRELTFKALFLGVILAIVLGAANAYLGLKAGMTVAATFPAAVISMAFLRPFKGTILEENIARTTGAVGEALAAGAIFTLPAFVMTGVWSDFDYVKSTLLMLVGGVLGVLLVIMLRKTMVEDVSLPYPESRACAEIVKAGQGGQTGAKYVFSSIGIAALIELFKNPNGIQIIKDTVKGYFHFALSKISLLDGKGQILKAFTENKETVTAQFSQKGGIFLQSPAASPAFLGVGYIIGFRLAAITFSGGVFGWLFLMPIVMFLMYNNLLPFTADGSWADIAKSAYSSTVKPIAVGGMLVGAFYTLFKMRKNLANGIKRGVADLKAAGGTKENNVLRTEKDVPFGFVLIAIGVIIICMIFLYQTFTHNIGSSILSAIVMGFAGLLFAAVAGYLVGIIGSSSNPISGLTLSTLLIAAVLMVLIGMKGDPGVAAVLGVASVVCCIAGVAGDMIQDWKVGHILGGTPWKMQIGGLLGVIAAALVLVLPIMLLHKANGIGSEALPAPQAGLMAMMSKGIVAGEMAWPLVIAGMLFSFALILIGSPSPMLIAVGMYLPFNTTSAIFVGGLIKLIVDAVAKKKIESQQDKDTLDNTGLLIASGLVAGEALVGIILAGLVVGNINLRELVGLPVTFHGFWWLGLLVFLFLGYILVRYPYKELIKSKSK